MKRKPIGEMTDLELRGAILRHGGGVMTRGLALDELLARTRFDASEHGRKEQREADFMRKVGPKMR